jgi:pyruvate,water dikinase
MPLTEDHGFYIDYRAMYQIRRVLVEAGRRLVEAGDIGDLDDLFYLTVDEIRSALAGQGGSDLPQAVSDRRAEMQRWAGFEPPPALGISDGGPPPGALGRSMAKFFGRDPVPPADEPGEIRGHAGSAGVARGTARILRSITDAHRLIPGDVLVATTTAPPWTPLFAAAAAVVTDTGGILSHCAVVAREYGIPAVVGCGDATERITDGDELEVDGTTGIVRIVTG